MESINVFGEPMIACSESPVTGYFRDGCCNTDATDQGVHTVCAVMTQEFLTFSRSVGNDLSTPRPQWSFPGLKPGDRWCLCAARFKEAYDNGCAPKVVLEATHQRTLSLVSFNELIELAFRTQ